MDTAELQGRDGMLWVSPGPGPPACRSPLPPAFGERVLQVGL